MRHSRSIRRTRTRRRCSKRAAIEAARARRGNLAGRLIDYFRVDELLGQGGMRAVYRAWDTRLFRAVALKTLLVDSETSRVRFLREVRTQARLRPPNAVPIHAVGEVEGCVYLVMDLVEGEALDEKIERKKRSTEHEALGVAQAIVEERWTVVPIMPATTPGANSELKVLVGYRGKGVGRIRAILHC